MSDAQPWTGVCYDCGAPFVASASTSHDGEPCPMCALLGRSGTIRADRPTMQATAPTLATPDAAPVTAPTEDRDAPQREYPCLDCGRVYPTPDHACPAERLRR